jgi:hypothetical protein
MSTRPRKSDCFDYEQLQNFSILNEPRTIRELVVKRSGRLICFVG